MSIKKVLIVIILIGVFFGGRYYYQENGMARAKADFEPYGTKAYQGKDEHFKNGVITVHRVYPYSGPASIEPYSYARHIAVDMEFQNVSNEIDLDDLDVIDGQTLESYGSDPDMIGLSLDGATMLPVATWPENPSHFRGLFIYVIREKTPDIHIGYWGHFITKTPVPVAEGEVLPFTPAKNDVYFTGSL